MSLDVVPEFLVTGRPKNSEKLFRIVMKPRRGRKLIRNGGNKNAIRGGIGILVSSAKTK